VLADAGLVDTGAEVQGLQRAALAGLDRPGRDPPALRFQRGGKCLQLRGRVTAGRLGRADHDQQRLAWRRRRRDEGAHRALPLLLPAFGLVEQGARETRRRRIRRVQRGQPQQRQRQGAGLQAAAQTAPALARLHVCRSPVVNAPLVARRA